MSSSITDANITCPLCGNGGLDLNQTPTVLNNSFQFSKPWAQLNIELKRGPQGPIESAVKLFKRLHALTVNPERLPGLYCFFMMRKPPDIRLRFSGENIVELRNNFTTLLEEGVDKKIVKHWFGSHYEPEKFLFGNSETLDIINKYFEADTLGWMSWEQIDWTNSNTTSRDVFITCVNNDLFFNTLKDSNEVWDVWCNLALCHQIEERDIDIQPPDISLESVFNIASEKERDLLFHYTSANRSLAKSLNDIWQRGELLFGLRSLLAFVSLFQWNRYGLSVPSRVKIIKSMISALNPSRGMRE